MGDVWHINTKRLGAGIQGVQEGLGPRGLDRGQKGARRIWSQGDKPRKALFIARVAVRRVELVLVWFSLFF